MLSRRFVTFLFFLFDKLKFPRHTTILYHAKLVLETFYIYIYMYVLLRNRILREGKNC